MITHLVHAVKKKMRGRFEDCLLTRLLILFLTRLSLIALLHGGGRLRKIGLIEVLFKIVVNLWF